MASNLAAVVAQTGERVLLVDADLRNLSLAAVFGGGVLNAVARPLHTPPP